MGNKMNADEFIDLLKSLLTPLVKSRTVLTSYFAGFNPGPSRESITVNFINLPLERFKQRRGGGAESENNRQLFWLMGFGKTAEASVDKVKIEQSINGIGFMGTWASSMRGKTATPKKVAAYLAKYINETAAKFEPYLSHE